MSRIPFPVCFIVAVTALAPSGLQAQSDSFAGATPIVALPVSGNNLTAEREPGEAFHGANIGGASVWYRWTPTVSGHYRVDLTGSSFDTELGLYTGTAVDNTVLLSQNDDSTPGTVLQSAALVYVRAGETIFIAVDGYNNDGQNPLRGNITLNIVALTAAEVPPVNDLFQNAADLGNGVGGSVTVNNTYGTREVGEPVVGVMSGGNSLWWKWTAPFDGPVQFAGSLATVGATPVPYNTGVGIYTGNTLTALTPVAADGASNASVARFNAVTGTTYYIAVDTSSIYLEIPEGEVTLRFGRDHIQTIFPLQSQWDWLHPSGIDPALSDPDFDTTWFSSGFYDGAAFNVQDLAPLGYGVIGFVDFLETFINDPGTGSRYSAYFRRTFTMDAPSLDVKASLLADDGAFIYLDGVLINTVNMDAGAVDVYAQLAQPGDESTLTALNIGPLAAGAHEIAVSVHNAANNSSDLGFAMSLFIDNTPAPPDVVLTPAGLSTGFEEPLVSASTYLRGSYGPAEIGWTSARGHVQSPASHPQVAAAGVAPTGKFFRLNAVRAAPFLSDRISLAGLNPAQKATITASVEVKTFTTSTTTFETADDLLITLESSTDGLAFSTAADILPFTAGGTPDSLLAISAATGDFVRFSSTPGAVPADAAFLRLSITGGCDSFSEYIYIDNLRLEVEGGAADGDSDGDGQTNASELFAGTDPNDPASLLQVISLTLDAALPSPSVTLTFSGVAGKVYQIEYSEPLTAGFTVLRDNITAAATGPVSEPGLTLPAGSKGFLRVRVKP